MATVQGDPYLQDDPNALAAGPEFDPNAVAAGAPAAAPVQMPGAPGVVTDTAAPPPVADPTVMSPVGQIPQSAIPGPAPAGAAPPPGPDVAKPPPPAAAGQAPAAALPPLGAPPPLPPLTGDHEKDTQNNLEWIRQSNAWHQQAMAHTAVIDTKKAAVQAQESDREAAEAKRASDERDRQNAAQTARREQNQRAIDQHVQDTMARQKDLETRDPMTGGKIVALIAGALGAARQDMASAQMGHPTVHPNAAMEVMNTMAATEYERKKNRLTNASEALLQARYGYKDSEDNHRAALNDLDADTSAHYKLIAKEAESQLRQAGAGSAEIASNEIVNQANQKSAEYENGIHEREEKQATERQHYAAEEGLTGAHLGLEKEQIQATIGARRDALDEKKAARADLDERKALDRQAREDAAKEKKAKDLDAVVINDPVTGLPMAKAPTARVKDKVASDVAAVEHYDQITHEYADHIDKFGVLKNPYSKDYKDRASLSAQVKAAGAALPNSGIQGNEKGAAMEEAVVGSPGLMFDQGHGKKADTAMLRKLAEERTAAASQRLRMELSPLEGDKTPRLPEFIHTAPTSPAARAKAVLANPKQRAALSDKELAIVTDAARGK